MDMINKIQDDRSRFDDGEDSIKFEHFPVVKDKIEEMPVIDHLQNSAEMEEKLEEMRR